MPFDLARLAVMATALLPAGCQIDPSPAPSQPQVTSAAPAELALGAGGLIAVGLPQFPAISPDGRTLVFSWVGDLWAVDSAGGAATRLTSHPAAERRVAFSPDGAMLAFDSERDGGRNLYIAPIVRSPAGYALGAMRRVTYVDRPLNLSGWSPDGKSLLFSATLDPAIYRSPRMYRVDIGGDGVPDPIERLTPAFGNTPRETADGKSIIFTRGNTDFTRPKYRGSGTTDLWSMNLKDGQFTQLTRNNASDANGFPLPDGSIVYISQRDGVNNIWRMPAAGDASAQQLTRFEATPGELTIGHGVRDLYVNTSGTAAVFCIWDTVYTLDLTKAGAAPRAISLVASADQAELDYARVNLNRDITETALSPDGKSIAMIARGEVFVRSTEEGRPTRRVTFTAGRERDLSWSPDGRVLWFASDEPGVSKIFYAAVALSREDIAGAKDEEPEKKDELKPAEGDKKPDAEKKDEGEKKDEEKKDDAAAAKPATKKVDYGKRWAESLRFDVKQLDTGSPERRRNDGMLGIEEHSPRPSPDGRQLLFTRGLGDLWLVDLRSKKSHLVLEGWNNPDAQWVADSKHIIYSREDLDFNSDVWVMDLSAKAGTPESEPRNITRHPDNDDQPRLSADGKVLYFISDRDGDSFEYQVYSVFLDKKLEGLKPYELEDYFKKAAEAAKKRKPIDPILWDSPEPAPATKATADAPAPEGDKKVDAAAAGDKQPDAAAKPAPAARAARKKPEPMKFDTEDAYLRVRRITSSSGNKGGIATTPGGERVIFTGEGGLAGGPATPPAPGAPAPDPAAGRTLYSASYKGDDVKSLQSGGAGDVRVTLTGDKVSFVRAGNAFATPPLGGKVDAYPIDAPVVIEIAKQQRQKFLEFARIMGNGFYHPTLKGLDWKGLTARYLALAERTRNNDEFNRVGALMLGELDGSHVGITGGAAAYTPPALGTGYLGIDYSRQGNGVKITRIIRGGPADRDSSKLEVGDVITAVDGQPVAGDLGAALVGTAGKEILIDITRVDPTKPKQLLITPVGSAADIDLRYTDEVLQRQAMVNKLSGGKLGYLHIRAMSGPSVRDYERDLYAAANGKQGLIIDVRDNGGGSTADILLSSLTAPAHAWTQPRGADPKDIPHDAYPRDRRLIYAYTRPITVLCNQNSFSNAEIFAHAIKTTKRGKVVGQPTYGGVISTGAATLIDGTNVRTPFRGWYLPDGKDFENNGAVPDIIIVQLPSDDAAGNDPQLDAAVKELMDRSGK